MAWAEISPSFGRFSDKVMIQDVLRNIGGIGIYGVVSVCLFFLVFGGVLLWAATLKKSYLNSMSSLPLSAETSGSATKGGAGHE